MEGQNGKWESDIPWKGGHTDRDIALEATRVLIKKLEEVKENIIRDDYNLDCKEKYPELYEIE